MSNPIEQVEMQKLIDRYLRRAEDSYYLRSNTFGFEVDDWVKVEAYIRSLEQDHKTMKGALEDDRLCYCERNPWGNKPCNRCKTISSLLIK